MKLLTQEIRLALPKLYATENVPLAKKIIITKFFAPWTSWTWYVVEGEPCESENGTEDFEFFGLVDGFEKEFGYFRLSELKVAKGPLGLKIERDRFVFKMPLEKLMSVDFLKYS